MDTVARNKHDIASISAQPPIPQEETFRVSTIEIISEAPCIETYEAASLLDEHRPLRIV